MPACVRWISIDAIECDILVANHQLIQIILPVSVIDCRSFAAIPTFTSVDVVVLNSIRLTIETKEENLVSTMEASNRNCCCSSVHPLKHGYQFHLRISSLRLLRGICYVMDVFRDCGS